MNAITFEPRSDAIILIRFHATPDDAQFRAYIEELDRRLGEAQRFGLMFQIEGDSRLDPEHRRQLSRWIGRNLPVLRTRCWGTVFALSSPISRLVLASLMALQRTPLQYKVVSTREQALDWLASVRS